MLAEKFILALETLIRSRTYPDGSPRVASTSPHVPVKFRSGCRIEPAFRAPSRLQPAPSRLQPKEWRAVRASRARRGRLNAGQG